MPHELTIQPETNIVHLVYTGTVQISERKIARDEVFRICRDKGLYRVLVDMSDSDIRMNENDAVQFSSAFQKADLPPNYRLACVISQETVVEKLLEILIALDHINIKYFHSREDAARWLTAV